MREDLNNIVQYIAAEQWDFSLACTDSELELRVDLFDGVLTLKNDGTWSYEAA